MMQKSTTFTTIFRVKKCHLHYEFGVKKCHFHYDMQKKNCILFFQVLSKKILYTAPILVVPSTADT
jgi:hypothetical protein